MLPFLLKKVFLAIVTILLVTFVTIALTSLSKITPLDVKKNKLLETTNELVLLESYQRPGIIENYRVWFSKALFLDFGWSEIYQKKVTELVFQKGKVTFAFLSLSLILAVGFSSLFGLITATYFPQKISKFIRVVLYFFQVTPIYILSLALILLFSSKNFLNLFPLGGIRSEGYSEFSFWEKISDLAYYSFLPLLTYFLYSIPELVFLMRNAARATCKLEFIRTAKAKGLTQFKIIFDHVLKYSIIPVISHINTLCLTLLTAAMIVERVFNINGLGSLTFKVIMERDFNTLVFINLLVAAFLILARFFSELILHYVDHRMEWGR